MGQPVPKQSAVAVENPTVSASEKQGSLKRCHSDSSAASRSSQASTAIPSTSGTESECSETEPSQPPPKKRHARRWGGRPVPAHAVVGVERQPVTRDVCRATHQIGLVGGNHYDSKETRLDQLLVRLPPTTKGDWIALIFCTDGSHAQVERVVAASRAAAGNTGFPEVCVLAGRTPRLLSGLRRCPIVINYDLPCGGYEYARRSMLAADSIQTGSTSSPHVVYTMLQEKQASGRAGQEIRNLFRLATRMARGDRNFGTAKIAELKTALEYFSKENTSGGNDGDHGADDEDGQGGGCDCIHCNSNIGCTLSYHSVQYSSRQAVPDVEVVRVPVSALEDLHSISHLVAPCLPGHCCTVICFHNMYCHTPWDGHEYMFALPRSMGSIRVVMVLAPGGSWHEYPDVGAFSAGVAWTDILDMDSMDVMDSLVEGLVEHEIALLGGRSDRLVLFGCSQGGGQSMLRLLRSQRQLGGWIGSVCHFPTAPHTPVRRDPLTAPARPLANQETPIRLLAGEMDSTFAPSLVTRDVERLQKVGGFADVELTVQAGLRHEGPIEHNSVPPELVFLQRHLPMMVGRASRV